jgi:hypothetical protein
VSFPFSTAPRVARTPADVLDAAGSKVLKTPALLNAELLYLASGRLEPTGELRARLRPWAEIWPRLPLRPLSEEATERIVVAIEHSTAVELELLEAVAVCRAGPQRDDVEARAAAIYATRDARGLFYDHHAALAAAYNDVRLVLERKQANAMQIADAARAALIATLRAAK